MQKVERLVNLIALLLNTRRPLTVDEIRFTIPGYQQEDYSSFKRMFERDKEELRAAGIPVERRFTDVWEVEEGYEIPRDRYYLPELDLTPEEMAALWLSSQVVVEAGGPGGKEDQALLKLSLGADAGSGPASPSWLRARLHLDAPALPQLLEAVAAKRRVIFEYKAPGRSTNTERTVDPYSLVHRQGAWYVVGHDHLRGAVRHFKLQRIASPVAFATEEETPDFEVPEGFRAEEETITEPWMGEEGTNVEIAFSPRIAWWIEQSLGLEAIGAWGDWTLVHLPVVDEDGFVSWVIGFGEDAIVRAPDRVRAAVMDRLRAFADEEGARKPARGTSSGGRSTASKSKPKRASGGRSRR